MSMLWGTVTQVGPLRVRLDGDSTALPFSPDSLATVLVGDRVRCEISGRRVVVIGRAGGSGPVGEHIVGEWSTGAVPSGCVLANGAVLNIADYPRLAAHYAAVYGASNFHGGNGTTTFAVPDTRERTYVNQGGSDIFAAIGAKLGTKTHTLSSAEMPTHKHTLLATLKMLATVSAAGGSGPSNGGFSVAMGGTTARFVHEVATADASAPSIWDVQNQGGGQAHNNVQPSFVCRYVIRAA